MEAGEAIGTEMDGNGEQGWNGSSNNSRREIWTAEGVIVKGKWTKKEDDVLMEMVNRFGPGKWCLKAQAIPGRSGKQCRRRWIYNLDPSINKDSWTTEEDIILLQAYQQFGNSWCTIKNLLPGRTDIAIKRHWRCNHMSEKLDMYKDDNFFLRRKKSKDNGLRRNSKPRVLISNSAIECTPQTSYAIRNPTLADWFPDTFLCESPLRVEIPADDHGEDSTGKSAQK